MTVVEQDGSWVREAYASSYARLVTAVAHIAGADRRDAEEAVQDAFLRLLRKARSGFVPDAPEAWVRKVALDALSNRRRKVRNGLRALGRTTPLPDLPGPDGAGLDLRRALVGLPETQRSAIVLHYYLDLPVAEIAVELGCAENTVKSHLLRGRKALHVQLAPVEDPP